MRISLQAIGIVRNTVREGADDNWGRIESEIELRPDLAEGSARSASFRTWSSSFT